MFNKAKEIETFIPCTWPSRSINCNTDATRSDVAWGNRIHIYIYVRGADRIKFPKDYTVQYNCFSQQSSTSCQIEAIAIYDTTFHPPWYHVHTCMCMYRFVRGSKKIVPRPILYCSLSRIERTCTGIFFPLFSRSLITYYTSCSVGCYKQQL